MNISKPEVRQEVFNKYGGRCAYCGCELKKRFTIDHIIPKRRGLNFNDQIKLSSQGKLGSDTIDNFNPCCISCNCSKLDFSLEQWRRELGLKVMRINRDSSPYRILKRFGMIKEINKPITFYFENYG